MNKIIKYTLYFLIIIVTLHIASVSFVHTFELTDDFVSHRDAFLQERENSADKVAISKDLFDLDYNRRLSYGLREGNEPYLIERSRECVLLAHGFTGSAWETRPLADHLAAQNYPFMVY